MPASLIKNIDHGAVSQRKGASISFQTSKLAGEHAPPIAKKVSAAKKALQKARELFDDAAAAILEARIAEAHGAWLAVLPKGVKLKAEYEAAKRKFERISSNPLLGESSSDHTDALATEGLVTQTNQALDIHQRLVADLALNYKTLAGIEPDESGPVLPKAAKPAAGSIRVVSSQRVQLIRDAADRTFGVTLQPNLDIVTLVPNVETDVPAWVLNNKHFLSLEASGLASAI